MTLFDVWKKLTDKSVDPNGLGVPHNTEVNRDRNRKKSTEEIITEIEERNTSGKPTWQLRQELLHRSDEELAERKRRMEEQFGKDDDYSDVDSYNL